jgi:SH3-like domain-containing protein
MLVCAVAAGRAEQRVALVVTETRLRKAPRANSEILMVIPGGTTVAAEDCRGGWCRVSCNGRTGYAIDRSLGDRRPGVAEERGRLNVPAVAARR